MTGPVVCGIDFSDHSRRALAWARFFASCLKQPLIVVHAVEPVLAEAAKVTSGPDALQTAIEPELRAFIGDDSGAMMMHIGMGEPASVLAGAGLSNRASLMVVGTQGLGRAARMWFGSTTMRLLRETTVPLLAVPPRSSDAPALTGFVVGTDFSEASQAAVTTALDLGLTCDVPVTCLHVVRTVAAHTRWNDLVQEGVGQAVQAGRRQLADMIAALPNGAALQTDVRTGDAADALIQAVEGTDQLIVVGLGGAHTGQAPGTTAYRVVSGADAPVLGVPARRA
jgi:nucleotide-binding universal stress UspA family protein